MQKLTKQEIIIQGSSSEKPITADITFHSDQMPKPLIILAHGFKGFKDWGPWPLLSENAAVEGFCFLKFNFSFNGTSPENLDDLSDKEAFGHNNFSKELNDFDRLLSYLSSEDIAGTFEIDLNQIFLIGHSRGGGISMIKAAEDKRIKKIATWASVHDFGSFFTEAELTYWKTHGVVYVKNSRTGENYPLYYQFVEDFLKNGERFVISEAIKDIDQPMMVIHGTNDETVNINAAFQLKEWKIDLDLQVIEGGTHTFGAQHPHYSDKLPSDLASVLKKTLEFFND